MQGSLFDSTDRVKHIVISLTRRFHAKEPGSRKYIGQYSQIILIEHQTH